MKLMSPKGDVAKYRTTESSRFFKRSVKRAGAPPVTGKLPYRTPERASGEKA